MSKDNAYLPNGFGWIVIGKRIYTLLKAGKYASAAHAARIGLRLGVFEDSGSWRTAALLNYRIGEDI